jgi:hypothetical protein
MDYNPAETAEDLNNLPGWVQNLLHVEAFCRRHQSATQITFIAALIMLNRRSKLKALAKFAQSLPSEAESNDFGMPVEELFAWLRDTPGRSFVSLSGKSMHVGLSKTAVVSLFNDFNDKKNVANVLDALNSELKSISK